MMRDAQGKVQKMLDEAVRAGNEGGIQVAAYYRGELIVDAWAGAADSATGTPVDGTTLFPVFSTGKGIAATTIHILAEQRKLHYDMRIAELWPEFGANGKEQATVRHALNHTTGIPQMPDGVGVREIGDWDRMCSAVAALTPLWAPGEHMEYHAVTFGWIVGEIARRADGRSFLTIMREEICGPLGIEDMYMGIPDEVEPRVATLQEPGFVMPAANWAEPQAVPEWLWPLHEWMNRPEGRRACAPASSGIMTARGVARHYAALLPGGVDGVELLPPSRIQEATVPAAPTDGTPTAVGMGYALSSAGGRASSGAPVVFGHGGYGGSNGFADRQHSLAFALTRNVFTQHDSGAAIVGELVKMIEGAQ